MFHVFVQAAEPIYVTMMTSPNVPGHVTVMDTADEKYERLFLNDVLEVFLGDCEFSIS